MTLSSFTRRPQLLTTAVLVSLLMLFMALAPETFLRSRIYVAYMSTIPFTLIMALGMTLVIIAGEIDLSFPSVMATGGFVFSNVLTLTGSFLPAAGAAFAAGALAGGVNGFLVVRIGVPSIIATIGTQFFWRGAVVLASGGLAVSLSDFRDSFWQHLLTGRFFGLFPAQALWAVFLAVVFWLVLNRHPYGDNLRFSGDNDVAASAMGIPVGRTKVMLFILMGMVSAFSGMLVCAEMSSWWPTQGEGYMLLVFASVFIGGTSVYGGTGTIYGTCIGAVIIGIIEAGIVSAGISGLWIRMVYGVIIIFSVSIFALAEKKG